MYRGNEASAVGAVMERKAANDDVGMIAAAVELWVVPPERPGFDGAAREVWYAIADASAIPQAIAAALTIVRDRKIIRPHAFIDIVEAIEDPRLLFELAHLVLEARWPVHPYLATIFFALVDGQHEHELWSFIRAEWVLLAKETPTWTLVGVILATTRIGRDPDLDAWFTEFERRPEIPMWIVAAYIVAIAPRTPPSRLAEIAARAIDRAVPDRTQILVALHALSSTLERRGLEAFRAEWRRRAITRDRLESLDHPLVVYMNGAKHRDAVRAEDLAFVLINRHDEYGRTAPRPVNWRLVVHLDDYDPFVENAIRILASFVDMIDVPKGDPRALELSLEMQTARLRALGHIAPSWRALRATKLTWFQRVRLELF